MCVCVCEGEREGKHNKNLASKKRKENCTVIAVDLVPRIKAPSRGPKRYTLFFSKALTACRVKQTGQINKDRHRLYRTLMHFAGGHCPGVEANASWQENGLLWVFLKCRDKDVTVHFFLQMSRKCPTCASVHSFFSFLNASRPLFFLSLGFCFAFNHSHIKHRHTQTHTRRAVILLTGATHKARSIKQSLLCMN